MLIHELSLVSNQCPAKLSWCWVSPLHSTTCVRLFTIVKNGLSLKIRGPVQKSVPAHKDFPKDRESNQARVSEATWIPQNAQFEPATPENKQEYGESTGDLELGLLGSWTPQVCGFDKSFASKHRTERRCPRSWRVVLNLLDHNGQHISFD